MNIKQTKIIIGYLFGFLFVAFGLVTLSGPTAHAYTCDYSGPGKDGKFNYNGGTYKLEGGDQGGSCYFMAPDSQDDSKKQEVIVNGQGTGKYVCTDGTVMHDDGHCWTYQKIWTNAKPTYDDGSAIPDAVYQNICKQQGTYFGAHYNYRSDLNTCEAAGLCPTDVGPVSIPGVTEGCRHIGDTTKTPNDINNGDPTKAAVDECKGAGATFNTTTHKCDWTEQTCPKKNSANRSDGGNGVWINGECKAYSDYTNQADCEKSPPGGKWQQDPSNPNHWECTKPDGKVNEDGSQGTQKVDDPAAKQDFGSCGGAETLLINCQTKGVAAIGDILKIGVVVLTTLVGIIAVGGLAWASIKYAKAQDNQSNVQEARELIRNIVIGILLYGFLVAIVNWLVPGGVIG